MTTTTDHKQAKVTWAENLWERLHKSFLDMEETLMTIIQSKAWEPLGYSSFSTAWGDKMSDITLASELRPHVVYAMFNEGATVDEITDTVKGVALATAEWLKEQKETGVPASQATTTVTQHQRRLPTQKKWMHFEIEPAWDSVAKMHGTTARTIALHAIQTAFKELT